MALPLQQMSVLVVDDDDAIREMVAWMLEESGCRVLLAHDGEQALDLLRRDGSVDVVVSDIDMPVMNGLELRRHLQGAWPSLPVLLMSGLGPPAEKVSFLPKPFSWNALVDALGRLAGSRSDQAAFA